MRPSGSRVLVVEDNREALSGLFTLLSNAGFCVYAAANGEDALAHLDAGPLPHVILLDLMMPKVTGWAILRHLQTDTTLREIPVVVMTALDAETARVVGADLVLHKPIQPRDLIEAVQRLAPPTETAN